MKRPELTKEIILIGVNQLIEDFPDDFKGQDTEAHRWNLVESYGGRTDGNDIMEILKDKYSWKDSLELIHILYYLEPYVDFAHRVQVSKEEVDNE